MVQTSIPASEVDRFIGLALKARDQKVSTLSIVPPLFDTYEPDAKLIRQKVAEAIDAAEGNAPKAADAESDAQAKPGKNKKPEAARRRHRWLGRLAERRVRRQRVPGPRHRLLRQPPRAVRSVGRCADRVDAVHPDRSREECAAVTPTVLAVDGNSLLHRAFHASARTMYRTPDGAQGWAVRGLLSQLVVRGRPGLRGRGRGRVRRPRQQQPQEAVAVLQGPAGAQAGEPRAAARPRRPGAARPRRRGGGAGGAGGRRRAGQRGRPGTDAGRPDGGGDLRPRQLLAHRRAHPDAPHPQRRRRRLAAARPRAAGDGDRRPARPVPRPRRPARRHLRQPPGRPRVRHQDRGPAAAGARHRAGRLRRRGHRRREVQRRDRQGPGQGARSRPRPRSGGCSTAR